MGTQKNNKLRPSLSWDEVVRCRPGGGDACVLPSICDKELQTKRHLLATPCKLSMKQQLNRETQDKSAACTDEVHEGVEHVHFDTDLKLHCRHKTIDR